MDIKEIVKKAFASELGQQLDSIYSTSDNRVFIRKEEAIRHAEGQLDKNTKPLADNSVLMWLEQYDADNSVGFLRVWPNK